MGKKIGLTLLAVSLLAGCGKGEVPATAEPAPSATSTLAASQTPSAAPSPTATSAPTPTPAPSSARAPEPSPTPAPDPLDAQIVAMSDEELIGQMVMIGFYGTKDMPEETVELMERYKVGNVILFGWNVNSFSQTEKLVDKINSHNANPEIPLTIAIDVEGGSVVRFQWKPWPSSALRLGQKNDPELVYQQYKRIGEGLREIGINMDLAPVLDIAKKPESTFLGKRMFGSDPDKVARLVPEAVRGLHDGGVLSMGKHFPGHGNTKTDSHNALPVIKRSLKKYRAYELIPFQAAVDADVDAMLVAHLSLPRIDEEITSVSPFVITELLRQEMGFTGVVMSDDVRMRAMTSQYAVGEAAVRHIEAGGDIVLIGKFLDRQREVFEALHQAVKEGRLTRERLETSVRRILLMKQKWQTPEGDTVQ